MPLRSHFTALLQQASPAVVSAKLWHANGGMHWPRTQRTAAFMGEPSASDGHRASAARRYGDSAGVEMIHCAIRLRPRRYGNTTGDGWRWDDPLRNHFRTSQASIACPIEAMPNNNKASARPAVRSAAAAPCGAPAKVGSLPRSKNNQQSVLHRRNATTVYRGTQVDTSD